MPGEPSPQLKDYLIYQDSTKGKPEAAEILLALHQKAREAGLAQEAQLHLLRAGQLYPANPTVRELLSRELGPGEFDKWAAEHAADTPFWRELGSIILYPAAAGAPMMLAAAAFGLSLGRMLEDLMKMIPIFKVLSVPAFAIGGLAWFTMAVILPGYFLAIVRETANGKDEFPSWPGFADPWGQVVLPTLKSLLVLMWSFLPLTLVLTAAARSNARPSLVLLLLSLAYGCLYFPMAFLMTSISGKLWPSLLPSNVVEAAAKTFRTYAKAVLLFWLFIIPSILLTVMWPMPLVGSLVPAFAGLYCWAAAMRLLGMFYRLEAVRLEWM